MDADQLAAIKARNKVQKQLIPAIKPREFILTMGVGGTGKSTGVLEIARMCPQSTFYCLDSELQNFNRLLSTSFTDLNNVVPVPVEDWDDYVDGISESNKKMGRDDWLAVDNATQSWDEVQAWFVDKIHGKDIDEWFVEKRKQKSQEKGFAALSGSDGDWQVINKTYFKHFYNALLKCPGHVYLTAEVDKIGKNDEKETKALYGDYGVKPKGQKRLGYVPMTVLWLTKSSVGNWQMTTIKDRGRREVEDMTVENFAKDYLMDIAGWRYE